MTRARIVALRRESIEISRRLNLVGLVTRWQAVADGRRAPHRRDAPGPSPAPTPARRSRRHGPVAAAAPPADALAFYRRGDIWTIGTAGSPRPAAPRQGPDAHHAACSPRRASSSTRSISSARPIAGTSASVAFASGMEVRGRGSGDSGPALDSQAKAAYRSRVAELQEEIDEAASFNDPERLANAQEELGFLARELAGAVGLGGRDRKTGSDAERARVNVTRAIRTALKRIADHDPALGARLGAAIKTGVFCVYEPPAGDEPEWDFEGPP